MITFLLVFGAALIVYYYVNLYNYWKHKNVKQAPLWDAFFEATLQTLKLRSFRDKHLHNYKRFPKSRYVGIYHYTRPMLLVTDVNLLKQLTINEADTFSDHQMWAPPGADHFWDRNLFALRGKQWKTMRSTVSPAFTTSKLRAMVTLMNETAQEFCKHFAKEGHTNAAINMKDAYRRYSNDVIANCAFGFKCDSLAFPNNDFFLNGIRATDFSSFWRSIQMLLAIVPNIKSFVNIYFFEPSVSEYFKKRIFEQLKVRKEQNIVRPDIIHLIQEAQKRQTTSDNERMDFDLDIVAQALFFFIAGFETVSTGLSFISYELALHPEIQIRLRKEIDEKRLECGDKLTYDVLLEMKYLDMVISEGLRKWSPVDFTDRRLSQSYTIRKDANYPDEANELILERDSCIVIAINAIQNDPRHFPNPDVFDPERFNEENVRKITSGTYMPFGIGPRNCIGSRFAFIELKVALFHLLSHFEIAVDKNTQIPVRLAKGTFNLDSLDGIWLRYNKRQDL